MFGVSFIEGNVYSVGRDCQNSAHSTNIAINQILIYEHGDWHQLAMVNGCKNKNQLTKFKFLSLVSLKTTMFALFEKGVLQITLVKNGVFTKEQQFEENLLDCKDFAAIGLEDKIYIIGGKSGNGEILSKVVALDTTMEKHSIASMSTPRQGAAVATLGGQIYVAGGYNYEGRWLSSVECYNPGDVLLIMLTFVDPDHQRLTAGPEWRRCTTRDTSLPW